MIKIKVNEVETGGVQIRGGIIQGYWAPLLFNINSKKLLEEDTKGE